MKSVPYSCAVRHHDSKDLAEYSDVINALPSAHFEIFGSDPYDDWLKERAERREDRKARKRLKVVRSMMPKLPLARAWRLQRVGGKEQGL